MDLERLKQSLFKEENFRSKPYYDSEGHLTIGIGRNLDEGISEEEALFLLDRDVKGVIFECEQLPFWEQLSDPRQHVIADMVFNMGLPRFMKFERMISFIKKKDYNAASSEMLNSQWASQVKKRATDLAEIMRLGVFP